MELKILAVGDVVGTSGLDLLRRRLRPLRRLHQIDLCVVNGENVAGVGLTPQQAEQLLDAGADVITLGNHSYRCRQIADYLDDCPRILRPANDSPRFPGRGLGVFETEKGNVAVLNLIGRCNMPFGPDNPFLLADKLLRELDTKLIAVDFHAEATSEKLALGYYLDGRVSALWGTHTHVPTADDMILPNGTGYVTDLGMTGPIRSVLGVRVEQSVTQFCGGMNTRYETAPGPCKLESVVFTLDAQTGRCTKTERVIEHDTHSARR